MFWAKIIVYIAFIYLTVGILFAIWFVVFGITKLDESTKETSFGFRLIIFFGTVALWILPAWRLATGEKRPKEKNAHRLESEK